MESLKDTCLTASTLFHTRLAKPLIVTMSLFALASCGDCSCKDMKTAPNETDADDKVGASFTQQSTEEMSERMMALLRIQELDLVETQTKRFVSPTPEDRAKLKQELSFFQIVKTHVGEEALSTLRRDGNVDIGWVTPDVPDGRIEIEPDWFVVLPVKSRDAFLQRPEIEILEQDLARLNTREGQLWVSTKAVDYARGVTSDKGDHVVLASSADAAQHAVSLVNMHGRAQSIHVQMAVWPSRLGLTARWKMFSEELAQRLSAAGHGLLPARVGLVNTELYALRALGDEQNWPEPIQLQFEYKIRKDELKRIRLTAYVDAEQPGMTHIAALHDALQPRKASYPPMPKAPGDATFTFRMDRATLDDTFELMVPLTVQKLLAAKGEESMEALRGVLSNLLDHNRGATTISMYPQNHPLSVETFIGWEAMDIEALPGQARTFNEELIKRVWAPLHLASPADISKVERVKLKANPELEATRITFEVSGSKGPIDLGVCWIIFEKQYLSYFGQDPCDALDAQVAPAPTAQPASLTANFDLTDAMNLFYTSPNRSLSAQIGGQKHPITLNGYARAFEGKEQFILETQFDDGLLIRGLLNDFDALKSLWNPNRELELTDVLQRVSLEQALYQEPGFSFIGPPGITSGAPPAMFLGLPFSLPPAPPAQLQEAFTGKPPAPKSP